MKFFGINVPEHILPKDYLLSLSYEIVDGKKINSCDCSKVSANCHQGEDTTKLIVSIKDGKIILVPDRFKYVQNVIVKDKLQEYSSTVENSVEKSMTTNLYKINRSDNFNVMYKKDFHTMNEFIKLIFLDLY